MLCLPYAGFFCLFMTSSLREALICFFVMLTFNLKSRIRVTLSPLVCVWFRSTNSIPWVLVNTMGVVNTMSPFLYHKFLSIPWVLVNTMSPCQYHKTMSIPWVIINSKRYLNVQGIQRVPKGPIYPKSTYFLCFILVPINVYIRFTVIWGTHGFSCHSSEPPMEARKPQLYPAVFTFPSRGKWWLPGNFLIAQLCAACSMRRIGYSVEHMEINR